MASTVTRLQRAFRARYGKRGTVRRLKIDGGRAYYVIIGQSLFLLGRTSEEAFASIEHGNIKRYASQEELL